MLIWKSDLRSAISHGVSHLSTYGLTYEKGARYWAQLQKGQLVAVEEDTELEMYLYAIEMLTQHGMNHYEVSNFRPTRKRVSPQPDLLAGGCVVRLWARRCSVRKRYTHRQSPKHS